MIRYEMAADVRQEDSLYTRLMLKHAYDRHRAVEGYEGVGTRGRTYAPHLPSDSSTRGRGRRYFAPVMP